tara:strand:- start:1092 stop:1385 length:294 start_codon:yes stop_codon:yes gene_type:complete
MSGDLRLKQVRLSFALVELYRALQDIPVELMSNHDANVMFAVTNHHAFQKALDTRIRNEEIFRSTHLGAQGEATGFQSQAVGSTPTAPTTTEDDAMT